MFNFLPVIILLFVVTIYVVYFLLTSTWLSNRRGKLIILASLIVVSFGFIATFIILNFYNNFILRLLYLILAVLIGWLFYLTMFGIVFRLLTFFRISAPTKKKMAIIGVIGATLLFVIGIVYAFFPRVKTIEVKIENLPTEWQGKKIVQISDLHLGSIHGVNFLKKVTKIIDGLQPDYLIITGDLFDGHPGQVAKIGPELTRLSAANEVIFISGNHDKYLGLDKFRAYLDKANIISLIDEAVTVNNLEIIGYDFLDKEWRAGRQIKGLTNYNGQARLLLNHVPIQIEEAKALHISLQLSGHSHRGQMWPVSFLTKMIYGKYQYGLYSEGLYNIYTTSGLGSWGPPLRTFNRPEIVQIILK
jgi:predicted MPP superfamily phosphohydrolase